MAADAVERVMRQARMLTPDDKVRLHREVARLVSPIYQARWGDRWKAGMAAARGRA